MPPECKFDFGASPSILERLLHPNNVDFSNHACKKANGFLFSSSLKTLLNITLFNKMHQNLKGRYIHAAIILSGNIQMNGSFPVKLY